MTDFAETFVLGLMSVLKHQRKMMSSDDLVADDGLGTF